MSKTKTKPKTKLENVPGACKPCKGTGVLSDRGGINRADCPDCEGTGSAIKRVKNDAAD